MDRKPTTSDYAKEKRHRNVQYSTGQTPVHFPRHMDTLHPLAIHLDDVYKSILSSQCREITSSSHSLGRYFAAGGAGSGGGGGTIRGIHFAVDKLSEIDDKVLVLASSEREVEKGLGFDRFHEQL